MFNKILAHFAAIAFTASGLHAQTANIGAVQPSHTHSTPEELATLRKLRAGGNVIFVRHERTDHMTPDAQDFLVSSCAGQRNLNAAGVASAEQSGEEIRRLKIPISQVFASPMCRTQETARFMFGHYRVEPRLFSDWRIEKRSPQALTSDFRALVADSVMSGTNTVLVGHITSGMIFGMRLHEGEALVLTIDADRSPIVVGTIASSRWGDLIGDESTK